MADELIEEGCSNSTTRNPGSNPAEEELLEDEEALSLSDLPIDDEENLRSKLKEATPPSPDTPRPVVDPQEDFNFCSWADSSSKESEMCVADEVFFQGQILPMRHSVSFDGGGAVMITGRTTSRCLSRSESMDHSSSYSVGFTSASSRSSSINSHHSSSSGSSSSTIAVPKNKHTPKIQNQFQFSQPSPKPQIRSSNNKGTGGHIGINSNRNSTFWSFLRVGLVTTPPEIGVQDLKFRSKSSNSTKNIGSGSRNSASTSSINSSTFANNGSSKTIKEADKKQRRQHKFFVRNGVIFSGCKCSSNSVVGPIPSRVPINAITRSVSAKGEGHADEEDNSAATKKHSDTVRTTKKHDQQQQTGKQSLSRHRTFEWLKQLSLEAGVVIDEAEQNHQQQQQQQ